MDHASEIKHAASYDPPVRPHGFRVAAGSTGDFDIPSARLRESLAQSGLHTLLFHPLLYSTVSLELWWLTRSAHGLRK